tara:strand:+ start:289 stop:600 length:312 start_codon:yes stop_codon:yes gene_type:complete
LEAVTRPAAREELAPASSQAGTPEAGVAGADALEDEEVEELEAVPLEFGAGGVVIRREIRSEVGAAVGSDVESEGGFSVLFLVGNLFFGLALIWLVLKVLRGL